jgi:hypothetical protein
MVDKSSSKRHDFGAVNSSNNNEVEDLDSILKELEDKHNKRKSTKLPFLNTKDKFNTKKTEQNILR